MSKTTKYLLFPLFWVISMFLTGYLGLAIKSARPLNLFILLISIFFIGRFFRFFQQKGLFSQRDVFLFSLGLLFYLIATIVLHPRYWLILPPTFALLGFWVGASKWNQAIAVWLPLAIFYGFFFYPQQMIIQRNLFKIDTEPIYTTGVADRIVGKDGLTTMNSLKGKYVIAETWNEYCGSCLLAMRDLHPMMESFEENNPKFKHIYIYTNSKLPHNLTTSVFENSNLPYPEMPIYLDQDFTFYESFSQGDGFPQFFFIAPDGAIEEKLLGYNQNFQKSYYKKIKKFAQKSD